MRARKLVTRWDPRWALQGLNDKFRSTVESHEHAPIALFAKLQTPIASFWQNECPLPAVVRGYCDIAAQQ